MDETGLDETPRPRDEMSRLRQMRSAVPLLDPHELQGGMDLPWQLPGADVGSPARRSPLRPLAPTSSRWSGAAARSVRWSARAAMAVGLAAAVVASLMVIHHPEHPNPGRSPGRSRPDAEQTVALSARAVLLAAAARVQPPPAGPPGWYWRQRTVDGTAWRVGPATDTYVVEERLERQVWQRRTAPHRFDEVVSVRSLGAHPQTAVDEAAWRRDGLPTHWVVTFPAGGPDGRTRPATRVLRARPSAPEITHYSIPCLITRGEPVPQRGTCVRVEPAYALPTDPAELARALTRGPLTHDPEGATGALLLLAGGQVFTNAGPVVATPTTPETRAAVFRALAALPGVRSLGPVHDPIGRPGVAVATGTRREEGIGELERRLIIDPATGSLLASVDVALSASPNIQWAAPGNPVTWTAVVPAGWTPQAPEHSR